MKKWIILDYKNGNKRIDREEVIRAEERNFILTEQYTPEQIDEIKAELKTETAFNEWLERKINENLAPYLKGVVESEVKPDWNVLEYDSETGTYSLRENKEVKNMSIKCFVNYHKWTNSITLTIHYKHFMLVGYISNNGSTGWEIHELERPSNDYIEISFDVAKILSCIIDPKSPLTGNEEEELKENGEWCFVTFPDPPYGNWEWVSGLMPYEAYLNAREAGCYQHTDYSVCTFSSFQEAKEVYDRIKRRG